jgi:hypothetical protein
MPRLSCGHYVDDLLESYLVAVKDEAYDHYEQKFCHAVSYQCVCRECYDLLIDADRILLTREDEENYLLDTP